MTAFMAALLALVVAMGADRPSTMAGGPNDEASQLPCKIARPVDSSLAAPASLRISSRVTSEFGDRRLALTWTDVPEAELCYVVVTRLHPLRASVVKLPAGTTTYVVPGMFTQGIFSVRVWAVVGEKRTLAAKAQLVQWFIP